MPESASSFKLTTLCGSCVSSRLGLSLLFFYLLCLLNAQDQEAEEGSVLLNFVAVVDGKSQAGLLKMEKGCPPQESAPPYPGPPYPGPPYHDPSYPGPSYPGPSYPGPSYPGPSYPGPSCPGPSYPGPSYPGPPMPQPGMYPQPGYPPAPHPAGYQGGVVITQAATVSTGTCIVGPIQQDTPVRTVCPFCQQSVVTNTEHISGLLTWAIFGGLALFGCWLCCFFPFCIDSCKDVEHRCPSCHRVISIFKRM
ncbi:uncharacterized protein PAE49_023746 [Odontesthes bonariensis]|uniref:uncharacterized protein LOC142371119 n=1 Tax=Odontesthes bonariensis TaxID=219752 RepID=UPI003F588BCF